MIEFYKKAFLTFVILAILTLMVIYASLDHIFLNGPLLPSDKSSLTWQTEIRTDDEQGGRSQTILKDEKYSLDVDFHLTNDTQYPYASISLVFYDTEGKPKLVDLSHYQSLSFTVKCKPHNVLLFAVYTVDDNTTVLDDLLTYRTPTTFISCDENWEKVELDLTRLKTPQWWFDRFALELSNQTYQLDRVPRLSIGTTHQSPMNIDGNVQINQLTLHGHDWRFFAIMLACLLVVWLGFIFWLFKLHTKTLINDLKEKLHKDRPLVAYQKLSIEPQRDKEKAAILRFIATEYSNPELNLELTIAALGVSRTKINDILKEELGFTFTAYLNKLRLTEAGRLLSSKAEANVAEIAYSVGYKNVTYFNKLFKSEFGCSPKAFTRIQNNE